MGGVAALGTDARDEERDLIADGGADPGELGRTRSADHEPALPMIVPPLGHEPGHPLVQRDPADVQVLEVIAARVRRAAQDEDALSRCSRNGAIESPPRYGFTVTASAP